jgi:hypothetical protein
VAAARCTVAISEEYRDMIHAQDPRSAAAITAMSLDLAELLATIEQVRGQLRRLQAGLICAQLDAAEADLPATPQ